MTDFVDPLTKRCDRVLFNAPLSQPLPDKTASPNLTCHRLGSKL